jgi:hypothetical protein
MFGSSTGGGSLSIDELYGELVLCRTFTPDALSAPAFGSQVELFVAAAEHWHGRINDAPAGAAPAARPSAPPQMMDHFLRG